MIKPFLLSVLCLGFLSYGSPVAALTPATQPAAKLNSSDTLQGNLNRHVGAKVEVVLISGKSLTGTVKEVGNAFVHLTALEGRDFFDALIRHDQIGAIVVRTK